MSEIWLHYVMVFFLVFVPQALLSQTKKGGELNNYDFRGTIPRPLPLCPHLGFRHYFYEIYTRNYHLQK